PTATSTLSLHDALPICRRAGNRPAKSEKAPDNQFGPQQQSSRAKQGTAGTAGAGGQRRHASAARVRAAQSQSDGAHRTSGFAAQERKSTRLNFHHRSSS